LKLLSIMLRSEGWGRSEGRKVYQKIIEFVESNPGKTTFKISLEGVKRMDLSFASETIVEIARRYRQRKGFCLVDLIDEDIIENLDAAAAKKEQPLLVWNKKEVRLIGRKPSEGTRLALMFALRNPMARATDFAATKSNLTIANASMKFKQLWQQGFLLRWEKTAESGGVEFHYDRIA